MTKKEIIDYYYNPNIECTCEAIFDDTHRAWCKRRARPKKDDKMKQCKKCKYLKEKICTYSNLSAELYSICPRKIRQK